MPDTEHLVRIALADFEAIGVEEQDGKLYLPTEIRRRNAKGEVEAADRVLLTIPTIPQKNRARVESRAYGLKEFKLDLDRDAQQFADLESYAILSFAIRDPKTKQQHLPTLGDIIDRYSDASLAECWGRLNHWTELNDPRFGEISAEQLWQVIAALSRGNLLPLVHMPTYAQSTCFALMAKEAICSPSAPSWVRSPATSNSDASTPSSSSDASAEPIPAAPDDVEA